MGFLAANVAFADSDLPEQIRNLKDMWVITNPGPNFGEPILFTGNGELMHGRYGGAQLKHIRGDEYELSYTYFNKKGKHLRQKVKSALQKKCRLSISVENDDTVKFKNLGATSRFCSFGKIEKTMNPQEMDEAGAMKSYVCESLRSKKQFTGSDYLRELTDFCTRKTPPDAKEVAKELNSLKRLCHLGCDLGASEARSTCDQNCVRLEGQLDGAADAIKLIRKTSCEEDSNAPADSFDREKAGATH